MKIKIIKYKTVTSTNDVAINLIKNKNKEMGFVYADKQTNGKGTYGKKWVSQKGNLFGSIFFPLKKNYPPFNEFFIINSIILSNVIKHFCKKTIVNLKFPNDIYINEKKACGILQEIITFNKKKFLIIGIGLNTVINPYIGKKYRTTSIFRETNKKPNIKKIIKLIVFSYIKFLTNIRSYEYDKIKKTANIMVLK